MLQKKWFYIVLGLVVAVVYARLLIGHMTSAPVAPSEFSAGLDAPAEESSEEPGLLARELEASHVIEVLNQRPWLMLALSFWLAAAICLLVGGLILNARAASIARLRRIFRYRAPVPRVWSLRDAGRIALLLVLLVSLLPFVRIALHAWDILPMDDTHVWSIAGMIVVHAWTLLVVWGLASAKSASLSKAFGLSWRRARSAMRAGLTGYVAMVPWILGLLWLLLAVCRQLGIEPPVEPIQELIYLERRPWLVGLTVVLACVVGPIVEEVLFRGVLFPAVRAHSSRLVAMLISGGLFSALHTNIIGFVPILVLGCLLADVYERTGSLIGCISVHIVHNVFLMSFGLILRAFL